MPSFHPLRSPLVPLLHSRVLATGPWQPKAGLELSSFGICTPRTRAESTGALKEEGGNTEGAWAPVLHFHPLETGAGAAWDQRKARDLAFLSPGTHHSTEGVICQAASVSYSLFFFPEQRPLHGAIRSRKKKDVWIILRDTIRR